MPNLKETPAEEMLRRENDKLRARLVLSRETLRDKFAMVALQGLLLHLGHPVKAPPRLWFAAEAYAYADAMLAYRDPQ
jgi:hypothetical protein